MKVINYQTELLPNENSLAKRFPDIAAEWDCEKNDGLTPDMFSYASNQKVWWKCKKGHEWQAAINARTGKAHSGCPICSNRIVLKGYNNLLSQNPELSKQWDQEKNGDLKPDQVTATSSKKVWWICDKGHSFEAKVYDRNKKNQGCPYCINLKFKPEYNSLAVLRPDLAEEWDYEKNDPLTPRDVLCGGDKKYWWKCSKEPHSYLQNIGDRIQKSSQCPYCSSQKLLKGFNDFATKKPELLGLWNYEKNSDLQPDDVMEFSNKKVWWKCPDCGYEWKTAVCLVSSGSRCPKCSEVYKVSEPEQIIYYYLSQFFMDAEITAHREWLKRKEIDILIPSINLAIEYDGAFWHKKTMKRDVEKGKAIIEQGYSLIRVREDQLETIQDGSYIIRVPISPYDYSRLSQPIKDIFGWISRNRGLDIHPDINVDRDWKKILASEKSIKRNRSIVVTDPDAANLWNYERNQGLKPDQIFAGSNKKVWWKCPDCGYEWEALVINVVKTGSKCPACLIKEKQNINAIFNQKDSDYNDQNIEYKSPRMIIGLNDLKTLRKDIADEWNYEKNGDLKPEFFSVGSSKKVWWKCSQCGHQWKTSVSNRTYGFGCPKCGKEKAARSSSQNRVIIGENDFATINPVAASQWNYEKNGDLKPDSLTANSNLMVWWKCPDCGNEWEATIASRKNSKDCPFCINRRFQEGFNDIFSKKPELKKEWDYEKNINIDPSKTICSSHEKAWWKCSKCGYKWKTTVYSRYRGSGCPKCSHAEGLRNRTKRLALEGNSFGNLFPEISKEWQNEKNEGITPFDITAHNGKKFWWKCSKCGHEWQATPNHRAQGTGCPKCKDINNGIIRRKRVMNADTGEIFNSASDAAEKYGVTASAISFCCSGKTKKSAGYHWRYIESSDNN